jgi:transcriptional regulator with XRE-family HTH domain
MSIGERVRTLRTGTGKGIKQIELAKILNSSSAVLSAIEVDKNAPSIEMLNALSKFFNVSTDYILNGKEGTNEISEEEREILEVLRGDRDMTNAVIEFAKVKKKTISYMRNYKLSEQHIAMGWVNDGIYKRKSATE